MLPAQSVQWERAVGYADLLSRYTFDMWLLPSTVRTLACARSEVIHRSAGAGPVLLMDDDAVCFRQSFRTSRGGYTCICT